MKRLTRVFLTAALALAFIGLIFPVLWFVALSLKSQRVAFQAPPVFVFRPNLSAYREVFQPGSKYPLYLFNSIKVASFNTLLCLVLGLPAAYAFSRFRFAMRRASLMAILVARMLPPIILMVPFYLLANKLRLIDTGLALILAYMVYNLPFIIWMMKGFFDDIPRVLDESAQIDGCSHWGAFLRIVLPLCGPGLAVTCTLNFIFSWNEFLWASVLTGMRSKTMTVGISAFWTNVSLEWTKIGAASTIFLLPPILLAILFRKYMVGGLTLGAVKG